MGYNSVDEDRFSKTEEKTVTFSIAALKMQKDFLKQQLDNVNRMLDEAKKLGMRT